MVYQYKSNGKNYVLYSWGSTLTFETGCPVYKVLCCRRIERRVCSEPSGVNPHGPIEWPTTPSSQLVGSSLSTHEGRLWWVYCIFVSTFFLSKQYMITIA